MIYKFRIILDADEDIFRDIEIEASSSLEDFHNSITQAFGFDGMEMASFYLSDEKWNQGEEISLFDMGDGTSDVRLMNESFLEDVVTEENNKLIYVYDFFTMWTFFVELAEISEKEDGRSYPNLLFAHGNLPEQAPDKQFESEGAEETESSDEMDIEDYDDLDFDENWN
ncbi:hypothetical protein GWK08_18775 [Leptobacterium flavescens]|uniref:Plasmid pRiA4b Orf3-like domain-containing protein n=1 Tax=Leptobacterium flavescens TaxID=472055 RepID=A0A6P0UYH9_9FLAO|nr:plasmid pRiA4b ORF-3 family protein [Leptobacterium flavescens]NER15506.1 hypothetical protein [Leptobacterium flavescens]